MSDGKPNLSGVCQSLGRADWDIEDHSAEPPPPFFQPGAIGATPPSHTVTLGRSEAA
jgi:hypothetical protein